MNPKLVFGLCMAVAVVQLAIVIVARKVFMHAAVSETNCGLANLSTLSARLVRKST
jgi:hypothetical protein